MLTVAAGAATGARDFDCQRVGVPCQQACPAHTDIPGYLEAIAAGDYERAYRINLCDNVFPGVLGRVCTRPCEEVCRHGAEGLGEPVAICTSKRAAADFRDGCEPIAHPSAGYRSIRLAWPAELPNRDDGRLADRLGS